MKQTSKLVFLIWAALIANPASADLIVNGSFEIPLVPNGSFTNFAGGSTAVTGWTVVGVDSSVVSGTFMQSGITFQAQSGNQWADMAGVTSNSNTSGLRQIVATVPGLSYDLEFYVGSATDGVFFFPATVDLSIDGGARQSYFNPTGPSNMLDWKFFSVEFTATSATTSLTFFNGSAGNNFISPLDNVSLTAVPEPTSLALCLIGLGMPILAARYRRRNSHRTRPCNERQSPTVGQ